MVYKDSTQMVEQSLTTYEDLVKLVSDTSAKTIFVVRDMLQAQMMLVFWMTHFTMLATAAMIYIIDLQPYPPLRNTTSRSW